MSTLRPRTSVVAALTAAVAWSLTATAAAGTGVQSVDAPSGTPPVMLVVDTSGSMGEDDGTGRTKIEGARAALLNFINRAEPGMRIGMRTYPAASGGCDSGVKPFDLAPRDPAEMSATIRTLTADGDTPTGEALKAAAADLRASGDTQGLLILVSDGESTCAADPCEVARSIAGSGIDLEILSIGFQISPSGAKELRCIAEATGGAYVDASDNDRLREALDDLTRPTLSVDLAYPRQVVADVGSEGDGTVVIRARIRNVSELDARDVSTRIIFAEGQSPGVLAPSKVLGNLQAGAEREVAWRVRPALLLAEPVMRFRVVARGQNLREDVAADGELRVVDASGPSDAGPLLSRAKRIGILGDSYSAGEGAENYLGSPERCHRSRSTYLVEAFSIPAELILACSGAITADVRNPDYANGTLRTGRVESQADQLAAAQRSGGPIDAVFMTLGGNDAGFATIVKSCLVLRDCSKRILPYTSANAYLTSRMRFLGSDLRAAYAEIDAVLNAADMVRSRGRRAPIVVLAYPRIAPGARTARFCPSLATLEPNEVKFISEFQTRLNGEVEAAVNVAAKLGDPVWFMPLTEDAFLPDHTICDKEPWARSIESGDFVSGPSTDLQELFHPNAVGYKAMTRSIIRWSLTEQGRAAADPGDRPPPRINPGDSPAEMLGAPKESTLILQPATEAFTLQQGVSYPLRVEGFAPGSPVNVAVRSDPMAVGFAYADPEGVLDTVVAIGGRVPPGAHTLVAEGIGSNEAPYVSEIAIIVNSDATRFPAAAAFAIMGASGMLIAGTMLLAISKARLSSATSAGLRGETRGRQDPPGPTQAEV